MKKRVLICLVLVVCLAFAGCGDKDKNIKGLGKFEGLDPEIELQIIKDYYGKDYKGQKSVDDNPIEFYYGTYNGSVAVKLLGFAIFLLSEETVEGVVFKYPDSRKIRIWKNGEFYRLQIAYNNNWLTKNDLEEIKARTEGLFST